MRKLVPDRMPRLVMRNRWVFRRAEAAVAKRRVLRGMLYRTIVCVNHMACRASARAIVAGLIVRSRHRKQRVEQTRLLQAKEHGIGAKLGAESARAELVVGLARIVGTHRLADFALRPAAAFANAQDVARLRNFPPFEWRDFMQDVL